MSDEEKDEEYTVGAAIESVMNVFHELDEVLGSGESCTYQLTTEHSKLISEAQDTLYNIDERLNAINEFAPIGDEEDEWTVIDALHDVIGFVRELEPPLEKES